MRDWGGYGTIIEEAREIDREERGKPPEGCPLCGTPLDVRDDGVRNCKMGHFTWGGPIMRKGRGG